MWNLHSCNCLFALVKTFLNVLNFVKYLLAHRLNEISAVFKKTENLLYKIIYVQCQNMLGHLYFVIICILFDCHTSAVLFALTWVIQETRFSLFHSFLTSSFTYTYIYVWTQKCFSPSTSHHADRSHCTRLVLTRIMRW